MKRRLPSRPTSYYVWTRSEQPGPPKVGTSQLLGKYESGEDAVNDAEKWLDEEDAKQGQGVELLRFEDFEYRKLLGKHSRKLYTVVMENDLWKKSNVVWTEAVPLRRDC